MNIAYLKKQIEACIQAHNTLLPVLPILTDDEKLKEAQKKMEDGRVLLSEAINELRDIYNEHS